MNTKQVRLKTHREFDQLLGQMRPRRCRSGPVSVSEFEQRSIKCVTHLLITTFLQMICEQAEHDPKRNVLLFTGLYDKIRKIREIKLPDFIVTNPELQNMRARFQQMLWSLIDKERRFILQQSGTSDLCITPLRLLSNSEFPDHSNRYRHEFIELESIAEGGFGTVFKVKNINDKMCYAVKKIVVDHTNIRKSEQIMREVRIYATLSHPNIISYKTCWLEMMHPKDEDLLNLRKGETTTSASSHSTDDFHGEASGAKHDRTEKAYYVDGEVSRVNECTSNGYVAQYVRSVDRLSAWCLKESFRPYSAADDTDAQVLCEPVQPPCGVKISELPANVDDGVSVNPRICMDQAEGGVNARSLKDLCSPTQSHSRKGAAIGFPNAPEMASLSCAEADQQTLLPCGILVTNFSHLVNSNVCYRQNSKEVSKPKILYILMELGSRSLESWLDTRKREEMENGIEKMSVVLDIFKQVLEGVHYIHSQHIIHRDLKPANILFGSDDKTIKIVDFGLAKSCLCIDENGNHRSSLSCQGRCEKFSRGVGTGVYIAPEQKDGNNYDNKADMYSLGIILLELVYPFGTVTEKIMCVDRLKNEGILPQEVAEFWPEIGEMIKKLTSEKPKKRPSAEEVLKSSLFDEKRQEIVKFRNLLKRKETVIMRKNARITKLEAEVEKLKKLLDKHGINYTT